MRSTTVVGGSVAQVVHWPEPAVDHRVDRLARGRRRRQERPARRVDAELEVGRRSIVVGRPGAEQVHDLVAVPPELGKARRRVVHPLGVVDEVLPLPQPRRPDVDLVVPAIIIK